MDSCPACGEMAVIEDDSGNAGLQQVCAECGVVLSTSVNFVAGDSSESSRSSTWLFQDQPVPKRIFDSRKELEALKNGLDTISRHGSVLGLTEAMVEQCKQMFTEAYKEHFLNRHTDFKHLLAASCVYCVCRLHNYCISICQICDFAQCDARQFGHVFKELCHKKGVLLPGYSVGSAIAGVINKQKWENFDSIIRKVKAVLRVCDHFWLVTGRRPAQIITPALFLAWTSQDFSARRKIPFSVFCKQNNLSLTDACRKRHREMTAMLVELSAKIPWISAGQVSAKNVAMFLEDILKYQRSLLLDANSDHKDESDCEEGRKNEKAILPPCLKKRRLSNSNELSQSQEEANEVHHDLDGEELTANDIADSELVNYIRDPSEVKDHQALMLRLQSRIK